MTDQGQPPHNGKDSKSFLGCVTINNYMATTNINPNTGKPKVSSRGGARAGAGRPKGSTDRVTVAGLLEAIDVSAGRPYMDLLAEDFVHARQNDRHLAQKYHNLILNKVSATLTAVEVTDSQEAIDTKRAAFADALAALTGIKMNKESE
jgi:hypothetical protein